MTFLKHWWLALFECLPFWALRGLGLLFWGVSLAAYLVALMVVLLYWSHQMFRVEQWLSEVAEEPPQAAGVWGLLFDYIHRLQSQSAEDRVVSSRHCIIYRTH